MTGSLLGLAITGDLQDVCDALGRSAAWCQSEQRVLLPEQVGMCRAVGPLRGKYIQKYSGFF